MNSISKIKLLFLILFVPFFSFSQVFKAKVVGIKDGDTVVVLFENQPRTIRLEHVDCPEKNQPFGKKAKQFASDFCFGKEVEVVGNGKRDRNGRWIAIIICNGKNLNKELVRNGLAWHFKRYSKNKMYADLEMKARKKKVGLWQEENPIEPWNWRNYKKRIVTENLK